MPIDHFESFARAEGYYRSLPRDIRLAQLDRIDALYDQLYPTLRIYLFDARKLFSAPVTIFGPLLAAIYLGRNYLAFRDAERVQTITAHFDRLIREADVSSRDFRIEIARLKSLTV
jgi:hypothetical protein